MSARYQNKSGWKNTWLWKTIVRRSRKNSNEGAAVFLPKLTEWMNLLDEVISRGGTAPLDFTLHDASHSWRVADRIEQLLSPVTRSNLSDYELALLLLAAYGHDMGMTPARKKVEAHHRHLFDPEHSMLTVDERTQFQKFLDDYHARSIPLPLCTGTPTAEDLNLADELTAFYVRERHNDWGAEWIRSNLNGSLASLTDTTETLVRLCSSHHWGFERLTEEDFAPRRIGNPHPQVLHLRYLACLLRLADILENDPERTPEVIFRHRNMEQRELSVIHWQKDHALTIDLQGNQIRFEARPRSARVHKALIQLADWIDHELHGVAAFGEKLPDHFEVGGKNIHRKWTLTPGLKRDIQPSPGTYEYIDGAFRPNTQRLLQMLSGEQLYGEPLAAVRELLQNAFDAVREKIARRRLEPHVRNPTDPTLAEQFGNEEHVTLTLQSREVRGGGRTENQLWLVCEDSGVGLTKALITGYLLVSGRSQRHDLMALERRCEAAGFHLGRTGQFGIGVLSYFMLASEVRLTTTRFQGCGDLDAAGWHFVTHGVGDFGELHRMNASSSGASGTRVELRLRPEKCSNIEDFATALLTYLKQIIVRLPCAFKVQTEVLGMEPISWENRTGWTATAEDFLQAAQSNWNAPDKLEAKAEYLLSESELQDQRDAHKLYPGWLTQARDSLRCEFREVDLPVGLGRARLALPYFSLADGRSLAFVFRSEDMHLYAVDAINSYGDKGHALNLSTAKATSWKGIAAPMVFDDRHFQERDKLFGGHTPCAVTVDFTHADNSMLQINRAGIKLPEATTSLVCEFLASEIETFANEVLSPAHGRSYHMINLWARGKRLAPVDNVAWCGRKFTGHKLQPVFCSVSLPAVATYWGTDKAFSRSTDQTISSFGMGKNAFKVYNHQPSWTLPSSIKALVGPTKGGHAKQIPAAFWDQKTSQVPYDVGFPPEWSDVFVVSLPGKLICLNGVHRIRRMLTGPQAMALLDLQNRTTTIPWKDLEAVSSQSDAAWFLCRLAMAMLNYSQISEWETFQKNHHESRERIWKIAAGKGNVSDLKILVASQDSLVVLRSDSFKQIHDFPWSENSLLPLVTDEMWILRDVNSPKQGAMESDLQY